jgi:hypothetical protein
LDKLLESFASLPLYGQVALGIALFFLGRVLLVALIVPIASLAIPSPRRSADSPSSDFDVATKELEAALAAYSSKGQEEVRDYLSQKSEAEIEAIKKNPAVREFARALRQGPPQK